MLVSQLSSTLPSSAGGGGKGSPSSPGKKVFFTCNSIILTVALLLRDLRKIGVTLIIYYLFILSCICACTLPVTLFLLFLDSCDSKSIV